MLHEILDFNILFNMLIRNIEDECNLKYSIKLIKKIIVYNMNLQYKLLIN